MLATPSTSHVNYDRVYEPAEDSYLLLDTLSSETEAAFLRNRFPPDTVSPLGLEVGTGSGVVLAFLTTYANCILGRSDIVAFGVDVNKFAVKATGETVANAVKEARKGSLIPGSFGDCVIGDLTTAIKPSTVDMLIFNPPYVPTDSIPNFPLDTTITGPKDSFARDSHLLSLSTDGGADGMEITNRLLMQLPRVLSDRGVAYILLCAGNKPDETMQKIRDWRAENGRHWRAEKVGSSGKKAGWEKLCVIRVFRGQTGDTD